MDNLDIVPVCLCILDNVLCYASLPTETLQTSVIVLCKSVMKEKYCQDSWNIMRKLLGTDLGHAALWTMCSLMSDQANYDDENLLCGAVFHTNMGLWGSAPPLRCSSSSVLLSVSRVLKSQHSTVSYEVAVSVQRLINNQGVVLTEGIWDIICTILVQLNANIKHFEKCNMRNNFVSKIFHEIVDSIESLLVESRVLVNPDMFYNLIETIADDRNEKSVALLMDYKITQISATRPRWIQALCQFMEKFYKNSKRTAIRVKAIKSLSFIMDVNRAAYEEEILDKVVLTMKTNIKDEKDKNVKMAMSKLLIEFTLNCETKRCSELLSIIENQINVPFDQKWDAYDKIDPFEFKNVTFLIEGLIQIFIVKLYTLPSMHAITVFHMLVAHLERYYDRTGAFDHFYEIRFMIFEWMFKARANSTFHIGYPDERSGGMRFSHYLGIDAKQPIYMAAQQQQQQAKDAPEQQQTNFLALGGESFTTISIRRGCKAILKCLEFEKNWIVLRLVLLKIPDILQNKALIEGNDVDSLGKNLFKLVSLVWND